MAEYVTEAMTAGALGMSTGLEYGEGGFADTREISQLAGVVGRHGGYYTRVTSATAVTGPCWRRLRSS